MPNGQWVGHDRNARLPDDWPERREAVFARDGEVCHVCGQHGADQIDHVIPGDDHSLENLAPIHGSRVPPRCHLYKSSAEGGRAFQAQRPRRERPAERHPGLR